MKLFAPFCEGGVNQKMHWIAEKPHRISQQNLLAIAPAF